jgi:hypothetical protein
VSASPTGPEADAGRRGRLAALPFRSLVEMSAFVAAQRGAWSRTARKLVGAFIVLALVDLNSTHVRDVVRGLVASWQEAETLNKMGIIAATMDAEYASYGRYPEPEAFHDFVRQWVESFEGDPARDYWGTLIVVTVDGVGYELASCGRDRACGTADDLRRRGGY